ncbi:hypothetical protein [Xanthovirga aplysinae]|uniref:hypothetical protein n=1 Tax=Xanthovirga aplysinae TaxID=2529853 RepID=UPI0012BD3B90|nr:hypothetical protein [Xanthovirga aplysinae]MTI33155.1 hypothetical protein [Xanthovirga aplysinae]
MNIKEAIQRMAQAEDHRSVLGKVMEVDEEKACCDVELIVSSGEAEEEKDILFNVRLNGISNMTQGMTFIPKLESLVIVSLISDTDSFVSIFSDIEKVKLYTNEYRLNTDDNEISQVDIAYDPENDTNSLNMNFKEVSVNSKDNQAESSLGVYFQDITVNGEQSGESLVANSNKITINSSESIIINEDTETVKIAGKKITINGGGNNGMVIVDDLVEKINALEGKVDELITELMTHTHASGAPGSPTSPPMPPLKTAILGTKTTSAQISNPDVTH